MKILNHRVPIQISSFGWGAHANQETSRNENVSEYSLKDTGLEGNEQAILKSSVMSLAMIIPLTSWPSLATLLLIHPI